MTGRATSYAWDRAPPLARRILPVIAVSAADPTDAIVVCDPSQLHRHFERLFGITPGRNARQARGA